MEMYDPLSPGEFIREVYLEPTGLNPDEWALSLGIPSLTLDKLLKGSQNISPEVALMLSQTLGRSPESWLQLQKRYDAWQAKSSAANNVAN